MPMIEYAVDIWDLSGTDGRPNKVNEALRQELLALAEQDQSFLGSPKHDQNSDQVQRQLLDLMGRLRARLVEILDTLRVVGQEPGRRGRRGGGLDPGPAHHARPRRASSLPNAAARRRGGRGGRAVAGRVPGGLTVAHACAVAASNGSVVYFAALPGGGYCAELVTQAAGPRGAVCSTAEQTQRTPISVTVPFSEPIRPDSPVTVSGHVSSASARLVELVYPDGATVRVPLRGRRFDYAVPAARRHDLMTPGTVTAWDADGRALAERPVAVVAYWHAREGGRG